jgi:hypothetical protein
MRPYVKQLKDYHIINDISELTSYIGVQSKIILADGRPYKRVPSTALVDNVLVVSVSGSSTERWLYQPFGPVQKSVEYTAQNTNGNAQLAMVATLPETPITGSIIVTVGVLQKIGDGVKSTDCYFSNDGGLTARSISAIKSGDQLYWNGLIAGFDLINTDKIQITYNGLISATISSYASVSGGGDNTTKVATFNEMLALQSTLPSNSILDVFILSDSTDVETPGRPNKYLLTNTFYEKYATLDGTYDIVANPNNNPTANYLLDENMDFLTTEDLDPITT